MKRVFSFFAVALLAMPAAAADWWKMPTICKPNATTCYSSLGSGFDEAEWDEVGNCRGKKLVCPNAVLGGGQSSPTAFSKYELSDPAKIDPDFDISALDAKAGCFGMRKTRNNGTNAKVGSNWFNVYCNGALDAPDEVLPTGGIMLTPADQPTCETLRESGYIGILNGSCYGKPQYPKSDFYLECEGNNLLPTRIVALNGATPNITTAGTPPASTYPTTEEAAIALFDQMAEDANTQRAAHYAASGN
ncbi:MAG: hypothetical protein LBT45_02990 [Rickettsiales bacterium]|nr:hypothetical protein [Rickettsiales bacterium]